VECICTELTGITAVDVDNLGYVRVIAGIFKGLVTAYDVASGGSLRAIVGSISGTETIASGADVHVTRAGGLDRTQTIYVAKSGDDNLDGLTPDKPKLTIGAAITAAGTPASEAAAVTIKVLDNGTYTAGVTLPSWVNLFAPDAVLSGHLVINDDCRVTVGTMRDYIQKSSGSGVAFVRAQRLDPTGSDTCVTCTSGAVIVDVDYASTAVQAFLASGAKISGKVGTIEPKTNGAGIQAEDSGEIDLTVGRIVGTTGSTGVIVGSIIGSASVNLVCGVLNCPTAYTVANSSTLRIVSGSLSGTETIAAGCDVRVYGQNITFDTITGTKIGSAATQKLALWGATPIVQPSSTGETSGFAAGSGTGVNDDSTFTGNVGATAYTLGDIVKHLKNAGIIAQ
jgi:hypothetical protein